MQTQTINPATSPSDQEEYVTIVAPTLKQVMQQFRTSDLRQRGFCISGRVGRHRFSYVGDQQQTDLFDGAKMVAATFVRRITHS